MNELTTTEWIWICGVIAAIATGVFTWARRPLPAAEKSALLPTPVVPEAKTSSPDLPVLGYEEDDDVEPTKMTSKTSDGGVLTPPTTRIIYDEDAAIDEPTQNRALILVTGAGQTDKGLRRKRNEDSLLVLQDQGLFVVADGMGGYRGGALASDLAVRTLERAFVTETFEGAAHEALPKRASELARAIQMANSAIFSHARKDRSLEGMGTTICAARFSPNKQRLYVGHVGDSRVYCYREGTLAQMTADHTMKDYGVAGESAAHLSRAVGIWPTVPIDIVLCKPRPGDLYLLCSDGLTKMVADAEIERALRQHAPGEAVERLIAAANAHGGKDNVSVVVVRVEEPVANAA